MPDQFGPEYLLHKSVLRHSLVKRQYGCQFTFNFDIQQNFPIAGTFGGKELQEKSCFFNDN